MQIIAIIIANNCNTIANNCKSIAKNRNTIANKCNTFANNCNTIANNCNTIVNNCNTIVYQEIKKNYLQNLALMGFRRMRFSSKQTNKCWHILGWRTFSCEVSLQGLVTIVFFSFMKNTFYNSSILEWLYIEELS